MIYLLLHLCIWEWPSDSTEAFIGGLVDSIVVLAALAVVGVIP